MTDVIKEDVTGWARWGFGVGHRLYDIGMEAFMKLMDVQVAADEAVRLAKAGAKHAVMDRGAVVAMAQVYAESDDAVVERNRWPLVDVAGEHVDERAVLLQAVATRYGVEADVASGGATAAGSVQSWRLNGTQTGIEATVLVFGMLEAILAATVEAGGEAAWVDKVIKELGVENVIPGFGQRHLASNDVPDCTTETDVLATLRGPNPSAWATELIPEQLVAVACAHVVFDWARQVELMPDSMTSVRVRERLTVAEVVENACALHGLPVTMAPLRDRVEAVIEAACGHIDFGHVIGDSDHVRNALDHLARQLRDIRRLLLEGAQASDVEWIEVTPHDTRTTVTIPGKVIWFDGRIRLSCPACNSTTGWTIRTQPTRMGLDTEITCNACEQVRDWHPMVTPEWVTGVWRWTQVNSDPGMQPFAMRQAQLHRRVVEAGVVTWVPWSRVAEDYWIASWPKEFTALGQWLVNG